MAVEKQMADGSYAGIRERDNIELWRSGGDMYPAGGTDVNGNAVPAYFGGATLAFNIGGGTDTGGGLLAWQNTKGFDIIVTGHQLDVTTASTNSATSASFGSTTLSTGSASNMISAQKVGATGTFNGGALSVVVAQNNWITGSVSAGSSTGMVARAYFTYVPRPSAGAI